MSKKKEPSAAVAELFVTEPQPNDPPMEDDVAPDVPPDQMPPVESEPDKEPDKEPDPPTPPVEPEKEVKLVATKDFYAVIHGSTMTFKKGKVVTPQSAVQEILRQKGHPVVEVNSDIHFCKDCGAAQI